jgi:cephalosporin hydroxylase
MSVPNILFRAGFADAHAAISRISSVVSSRGGIPTYLDNRMVEILRHGVAPDTGLEMLRQYLRRLSGEGSRYLTWMQRESQLSEYASDTELDLRAMLYSQGAGEVFQWNGKACFKTLYELALYPMMLAEIRPHSIIELGAGLGGSATWLAGQCVALGLDATVYAVDLQANEAAGKSIRTYRRDCIEWLREKSAEREDFGSPVLVIEDFHGDLDQTLQALDEFLRPGDYLVIEDAIPKQAEMNRLLRGRACVIDTRYTDFFGLNCTSAVNGILKWM